MYKQISLTTTRLAILACVVLVMSGTSQAMTMARMRFFASKVLANTKQFVKKHTMVSLLGTASTTGGISYTITTLHKKQKEAGETEFKKAHQEDQQRAHTEHNQWVTNLKERQKVLCAQINKFRTENVGVPYPPAINNLVLELWDIDFILAHMDEES